MARIDGTSGNDRIKGKAPRDVINGLGGDDTLFGGDGKDRLIGGAGDDRICGGAEFDTLTGGSGSDKFVYTAVSDARFPDAETIRDFEQGFDRILFRGEFHTAATMHFIGKNVFSGTPGEVRYGTGGGESFVQIDLDGNGGADSVIYFTDEIQFQRSDFSF